MAWVSSVNRIKVSPFTGDARVYGEFEDINGDKTVCTVDGYSEQECVEYLADMQSESTRNPYHKLVFYSTIPTDCWN